MEYIEKREYLAILRRINLVSFADAGYSIGEYHNEVILATLITVLLVRKLKNFLLTAVAALAMLVVPLLLCLADLSAVRWISLNWFFT